MLVRKPKKNSIFDGIQNNHDEDKSEMNVIIAHSLDDEELLESNEVLDSPTELLIKAIKKNDYKSLFQAIQDKANVNILVEIPFCDLNNERERDLRC